MMVPVAMMHEEMHQRASERRQPNKKAKQMRAMFHP
jgi:hypothetical protein